MRLVFAVALIALLSTALSAETYLGVMMPAGTKAIGPHRFLSAKSYDETKKQLLQQFAKSKSIFKMAEEINLPHVRAMLFKNDDKNRIFDGINLYFNVQSGLTEIFFLMREIKNADKEKN